MARRSTTRPKSCAYDLYYIKHLSVFFDLTIVFDTVKVVLFRKGAA
jgi:lipopolysaccharide/colanic/teichoic acid biosynthesis glycosyltransferase